MCRQFRIGLPARISYYPSALFPWHTFYILKMSYSIKLPNLMVVLQNRCITEAESESSAGWLESWHLSLPLFLKVSTLWSAFKISPHLTGHWGVHVMISICWVTKERRRLGLFYVRVKFSLGSTMAFGEEDTQWSPLLPPSSHTVIFFLLAEVSNGFRVLQYCTTKR